MSRIRVNQKRRSPHKRGGLLQLGYLGVGEQGPVRQPRKSRLSANNQTRRINPPCSRTFCFLPKPPKKFVVRSNVFG